MRYIRRRGHASRGYRPGGRGFRSMSMPIRCRLRLKPFPPSLLLVLLELPLNISSSPFINKITPLCESLGPFWSGCHSFLNTRSALIIMVLLRLPAPGSIATGATFSVAKLIKIFLCDWFPCHLPRRGRLHASRWRSMFMDNSRRNIAVELMEPIA